MKQHLPAPSELLGGRAPGFASVDIDANGVVHRWMDLADRGNYLEAGERAAELLRGEASDLRLVAVYLVGWFVDRGAPALPELLACVDIAIGDGERTATSVATARTRDSAMEWLFRAVGDRAAFQTAQRDEVWDAWLQDITPEHIAEIAARSEAISARCPGGTDALHKLVRWARNKLGPAAERARKMATPPEVAKPAPFAPPPVRGWDEPETEDTREYEENERVADTAIVRDAPALASLREKLRAFEVLLARGQLDRAAVVARDIQGILAAFDPIVYLPALLGRYARLLSDSFVEIESHWQEADSARWQILTQFYRADLAGFIDE